MRCTAVSSSRSRFRAPRCGAGGWPGSRCAVLLLSVVLVFRMREPSIEGLAPIAGAYGFVLLALAACAIGLHPHLAGRPSRRRHGRGRLSALAPAARARRLCRLQARDPAGPPTSRPISTTRPPSAARASRSMRARAACRPMFRRAAPAPSARPIPRRCRSCSRCRPRWPSTSPGGRRSASAGRCSNRRGRAGAAARADRGCGAQPHPALLRRHHHPHAAPRRWQPHRYSLGLAPRQP
jgi:hypothetical protein